MLETHMNIMDLVVLGIMGLSCLVAFLRGFMRELLSLGAWIAAGLVTIYGFPTVAEYLKPHIKHETVAVGAAVIGTYVVSLILISILNSILIKYAKSGNDVGVLDNLLGLVFGALRGAFIVSLGFFLITYVMDKDQYPDWIESARTRPYAEAGARLLARMAPQYLQEMSSFAKEQGEQYREEKQDPNAGNEGGYSSGVQNGLDRLLHKDNDEQPAPVEYR